MNVCNKANQAAPAPADGAAVPDTVPVPSVRPCLARRGKMARLPNAIREALNERLRDGSPAIEILAWLNALTETREAMAKYFNGAPIAEHNLSQWRHGGYVGWLEHERAGRALSIMSTAGRNIDRPERDALNGNLALAPLFFGRKCG